MDHLGEVKAGIGKGYITDSLGSVLNSPVAGASMAYGLFGEPGNKPAISSSSAPKDFSYAGYSYNRESNDYGTDNRQYNSSVGRWNRQDPIGFDSGDLNLYRYVDNRPIEHVDPTGLGIISAGVCAAYDAYSAYQAAAGIRELSKQIDQIDGKIAQLQKQENTCPSDKRADLNNQINTLILQKVTLLQQKANEEAKGAAQGAAISAICAGLAKLKLPWYL